MGALLDIMKLKIMRSLMAKKNYGMFAVKEAGGNVNEYIGSYASDILFDRGNRSFAKPPVTRIYKKYNAPYCLFSYSDAVAKSLDIESPQYDGSARDPVILNGAVKLYTVQADARARRKFNFDPKMLLLVIIIVGVIALAGLYYGYATHDMLIKALPQLADTSKDNLANLIKTG